MFYQNERLALFVDGANLHGASKSLGFDIDYKRLMTEFSKRGRLIRAFYYTTLMENEEYSPLRPLIDWLDYNGFSMVTKPAKEYTDAQGRRRFKGSIDIELAVDAMEMADNVDHIVLFSGDGDFTRLVEALQRRGKRVSVVSTLKSTPPMISGRSAPAGRQFRRTAKPAAADPARSGGAGAGGRAARPAPGADGRRRGRAATASTAAAGRTGADPAGRSALKDFPPEAPRDCPLCPRLAAFRAANEAKYPAYYNGAVGSFGDDTPDLLIVGLAPGLHGANQTGRPFTGDYAGDLLYATLDAVGRLQGTYQARPDDGIRLKKAMITNAVRCVPPQNKPEPAEIRQCNCFLKSRMTNLPSVRAIVALGLIAHNAVLTALGKRKVLFPFKHGASHDLGDGRRFYDSYHCSRYNTNTGVLTPRMFLDVFERVERDLRT